MVPLLERAPGAAAPAAESLANATGDLTEAMRRSLVTIRSEAGGGSGTAWRRDGLVITNHHVVPGEHAEVILPGGQALHGRVVARDIENDLAAIRVDAELTPVEAGDSARLRAGEMVFAVGNPWGLRGSVAAGIIFAVGPAPEGGLPVREVIRADIRLAPGNSGGPLADARGRVVGINSMIAGGMGVAIPANTIARFIAERVGSGS